MKPKRSILIFDEELHLSGLSLVLRTYGYRVLSCTTEAQRAAVMGFSPVDLLLVGPRVESGYAGEVPMLSRPSEWSTAELVARIRVALVRRRGPKKPSAGLTAYRAEQGREA